MSPYRLLFRLPRSLGLSVLLGRHIPCLHGCVLIIDPDLQVAIEGPSREMIFSQARRFMRVTAKGHGPFIAAAVLYSPRGNRGDLWAVDTWHIAVVDGVVVISAGAIAPDIGTPARCTA